MMYVMKGDITRLDFDLIVNPANTTLLPGAGVNKEIFARAGMGLLNDVLSREEVEVGQVVVTDSYNLPCQAIIHAVGPVYALGAPQEEELLASCYWNSMAAAYDYLVSNQLEHLTLAFSAISTGAFGFPIEVACKIAVRTVKNVLRLYPDAKCIDVCFVCRQQKEYELYKKEISR